MKYFARSRKQPAAPTIRRRPGLPPTWPGLTRPSRPAPMYKRCNPSQQPSDEDGRVKPPPRRRSDVAICTSTLKPLALYQPPLKPTLAPHVMAGLDPAIGHPHQCANDAIPVSNYPMEIAGRAGVKPSDDVVGPLCAVRQQLGRLVLHQPPLLLTYSAQRSNPVMTVLGPDPRINPVISIGWLLNGIASFAIRDG